MATDKSAYLPGGGTFGVANVSSFSKGITGVMVELTGMHGALTPADFTVNMSGQQLAANNAFATWASAPAPTVTVFSDTPTAGIDRVHLTWADGAITDRYLRVVVEGDDPEGGNNTNTNLDSSDVFYFANKIGDVMQSSPTFNNTNVTDEVDVRFNQGTASILPTNVYDFDRNFFVNTSDELIARFNSGFLQWFSFSGPPAAPAAGGDDDGAGSAIASALAGAGVASHAATAAGGQIELLSVAAEPENVPEGRFWQQLGDASDARSKVVLSALEDLDDGLDLDQWLDGGAEL